jgi:hypothetical protein
MGCAYVCIREEKIRVGAAGLEVQGTQLVFHVSSKTLVSTFKEVGVCTTASRFKSGCA